MEWPREVVLRQALSDVEKILSSPRMARRLDNAPDPVLLYEPKGE